MLSNDLAFQAMPPQQAIEDLFGILEQDLKTTMMECFRAFNSASPLHPKGSGGTMAWIQGIRALRSVTLPKGWVLDDPKTSRASFRQMESMQSRWYVGTKILATPIEHHRRGISVVDRRPAVSRTTRGSRTSFLWLVRSYSDLPQEVILSRHFGSYCFM